MRLVLTVCYLLWSAIISAQVFDSELPATACIGQTMLLKNNLLPGAVDLEWDFCEGDLHLAPVVRTKTSIAALPIGVSLVQVQGVWYGFVCDRSNNRILRYDFGGDLTNANPDIVDLGTFDNKLQQPQGVKIIEHENEYYGFVYNLGGNALVRINFGSDIKGVAATADVLAADAGFPNGGIDIAFDGSDWVVMLTQTNTLKLFNLGDAPSNTVSGTLVTTALPNANNVGDIKLVKENDEWFGFTCAYTSQTFHRLHFGNTLFADPIATQLTVSTPYLPFGLEVVRDNGDWILFSSTLSGNLVRLVVGSDIQNNTPAYSDVGTLGMVNTLKISFAKNRSRWFALATRYDNGNHFILEFPQGACAFNKTYSHATDTLTVRALTAGSFQVSLNARISSGIIASQTSQITVSSNPSSNPILTNTMCAGVPTMLQFNTQTPLSSVIWDFNNDLSADMTGEQVEFDFGTTGTFYVSYQLVNENGCKNFGMKSIELFSPPVAGFTIPAGPLCTNNDIEFINTTPDSFDGNLVYQWFVDDQFSSSQRDLLSNFQNVSSKHLKLIVSIPGCSDEEIKTTPTFLQGPDVSFSVTGNCEDVVIQFTRSFVGSLVSESWDFGDGGFSNESAPSHTFSQSGSFEVLHSIQSANGCHNVSKKNIVINDRPSPDFVIDSPPSSCSQSMSQFSDLTPVPDGQLQSWQWDFGDGGNSDKQNPSHVFEHAGEYDVELTATTEYGCSNTVVKSVTILQSPNINFSNSVVCLGKQVTFSGSSNDGLQYYWEIGTSFYETRNTTHVFASPGSHLVKLNVIGSNDCVSTLTREVIVPAPVNPVFNVINNCKGYEASFTSATVSSDPIASQIWNFSGEGTSNDPNPSFTFQTVGNKLVTLQVTTVGGCVYQGQASVAVIDAPLAGFTFDPAFGVPPQEISFVNASLNATSFNWNFDDGGVSTEPSPRHTFTELGDYDVKLIVSNTAGCQHSITKSISMVSPLPDVDLSLMTITPNNDGTSKIIITIANNGNTFVKNLPVRLDVSGNVTLETIIPESIAPFSKYNLVLNFAIAESPTLEFLCASTTLEGDLNPEGNRICNQLKSDVTMLSPYPNPAKDFLTVEWVAQEGEQVKVDLVGTDGKTSVGFTEISGPGLNQKTLDISRLRSGIYILRLASPTKSKTHKIFVSGQN